MRAAGRVTVVTGTALLLACIGALALRAQSTGAAAPHMLDVGPPPPDPLQIGITALQKNDYTSANGFFTKYLEENPKDAAALFYEGNAELGLKQYDAAKARYTAALASNPRLWAARSNLVIVAAKQGDWKAFQAERATLAQAHAAHEAGLPAQLMNVVDDFEVNGQRYIVREYDPPLGKFHVKYNFVAYGPDGKVGGWISCESDDVDQISFAKAHPTAAGLGERSYSLDSYTPVTGGPDGQKTQTHGTLKFYPDGEPAYEAVRADVIRHASGKAGPISATTATQPGTP